MGKWQRVFYQPNLPLGKNGERVTASKGHIALSKAAAKEGMVLLKNDEGLLPLKTGTRLALFGKGTFDYVKGGGGSGDVTVAYIKNLYDGLNELSGDNNIQIYEELADYYRKNIKHQYARKKEPGMTVEPELCDELCQRARAFTDIAVITICRFSGEGWDRKSTYDNRIAADDTDHREELFEDGDFYLSHAEKAMVEKVRKYFDKIIVVMNVGGMVDTDWFINDDKIKSVLMAWQGGMEGGSAAAELLFGIGNPCGKLADTFAKRLEDYPSSYNFHESDRYVDYTEDIYVGYRYFETIPGAGDKVNYPFGFGLSYTTFKWEVASISCSGQAASKLSAPLTADSLDGTCELAVAINVTNTGNRAGKEVIQLYGGAPCGILGKPARSLVAFQKTRLLEAGETQLLTLSFPMSALASYDDLGKIQKSAYILEAGDYTFYVGNSVRNTEQLDYVYSLDNNVIVEQLTSRLSPTSLKERMLADGSFEALPTSAPYNPDYSELKKLANEESDGYTPQVRHLGSRCLWRNPFKEGVQPFINVAEGKITVDEFLAQLTDEEVAHILGGQPNTSTANTFGIGNMPEYGIPNIMTADGPAGLRIAPECGVNTTAFPCATLLACTWNRELVYKVGEAGAKEVKENNIAMWLTPAVNIHRSPLCGRNFEYYSEDPFLTGALASQMVQGIQSQHISASVKHFALNNKETNRKNSDSRVSERAAREIYLKAFEIIVKEAKPWCIMSSYNIVNGQRTSENSELLTGILRDEWGYEGLITTDWWSFGEHYKEVSAGNDVKMPCGFPTQLMDALEAGLLTREEMNTCAKRVLELILKLD